MIYTLLFPIPIWNPGSLRNIYIRVFELKMNLLSSLRYAQENVPLTIVHFLR
jgi:hypothetical protein